MKFYGYITIGECQLNLKIYAKPNTYYLNIMIDGYFDPLIFKNNSYKIIVNSCNSNQIQMIRNEIPYCENPICNKECQLFDPDNPEIASAKCRSPNATSINDITQNVCECTKGFMGKNCDTKVFMDFRYKFLLFCFFFFFSLKYQNII